MRRIAASLACVVCCLSASDLGHLQSLDRAGLAELRRLRAAGVSMEGAPPHLAAQILGDD